MQAEPEGRPFDLGDYSVLERLTQSQFRNRLYRAL
jgi:hypothetical protein